jgi:hypothetical protein
VAAEPIDARRPRVQRREERKEGTMLKRLAQFALLKQLYDRFRGRGRTRRV